MSTKKKQATSSTVTIKKIYKRDGRLVDFNPRKITRAIGKAMRAVGQERNQEELEKLTEWVLQSLERLYDGHTIPSVEQVQDAVEKVLMRHGQYEVARAYILYRDLHNKFRAITSMVDSDEMIGGYLEKLDWQVKENSNMGYSLQGLNAHVSAQISANYWLNKLYNADARDAHLSGDLHIHDLQLLAPYCVGWDLEDFLRRGFNGVEGKVACRPPKHLRSALGQLVNLLYTLQGETAGANAVSNFDTLLAPFVKMDGLTYREVKQCLQEFVYNLNVPTRVGFQTPFTNITFDLVVSPVLADQAVIVGGIPLNKKYRDFQPQMDMINQAFAEVMVEGDAQGRIFTFPIPTYNITKDFSWDNEKLDPVWRMTAKYGIPYFSNFINSDLKPEDARSMCCRLRLDNTELRKRGGGYFGSNPLTGSIGVVTINLARIGYLAKSKAGYLQRLERIMSLAKESLVQKREILERFTKGGLYPYSRFYLEPVYLKSKAYWSNHFSTIGLNGMNESLLNFMGTDIASEEGRAFALEVLDFMRDKISEYQKETGALFNLEATPAEGTSYRLALKDKKIYPDIRTAGGDGTNGASPYYTNSTQLPVGFTDDVFEALRLQDDLQVKYTGGTVLHCFLGESLESVDQTKRLVRKIAENFRLPYFTLTPTFSVCPQHGYLKGEQAVCPKCGVQTEVFSRVVGYLRPVKQWNAGKQTEYAERRPFVLHP